MSALFPQGIEGSGRLICEILRGVPGHFHSCAEKTLNSLFTAVNEKSFPQELVWQILHCTVSNIVKYIYVEHISVLWKIVFVSTFYYLISLFASTETLLNKIHLLVT